MKKIRNIINSKSKVDFYELAKESKKLCQWLGNGEFTYNGIKSLLNGEKPLTEEEELFLEAKKYNKKLYKAILTILYAGLDRYKNDDNEVIISYQLPPTYMAIALIKNNRFIPNFFLLRRIKRICR